MGNQFNGGLVDSHIPENFTRMPFIILLYFPTLADRRLVLRLQRVESPGRGVGRTRRSDRDGEWAVDDEHDVFVG